MKRIAFVLFLVGISLANAGSVRLVNDSPYPLKAVIRGQDGSYLGEKVVSMAQSATWNDHNTGQKELSLRSSRSKTPYTVNWYCLNGNMYSTATFVSTGSTVTAQSGVGPHECKPSDQEKAP